MLQPIVAGMSFSIGSECGQRPFAIVRMQPRLPLLERVPDFMVLIAELAFPPWREVHRVRAQIPVPQSDVGPVGRQLKSLTTLPQGALDLPSFDQLHRQLLVDRDEPLRLLRDSPLQFGLRLE